MGVQLRSDHVEVKERFAVTNPMETVPYWLKCHVTPYAQIFLGKDSHCRARGKRREDHDNSVCGMAECSYSGHAHWS